jgi:hypothetical protein
MVGQWLGNGWEMIVTGDTQQPFLTQHKFFGRCA